MISRERNIHSTHFTQAPFEERFKSLYDCFQKQRSRFLQHLCVNNPHVVKNTCEQYGALLFNRLIFLTFLEQKGFLDNDHAYFQHLLVRVQHALGTDHFHHAFLAAFCQTDCASLHLPPSAQTLFGQLPPTDTPICALRIPPWASKIHIPDQAFAELFAFFAMYNWCLDEQAAVTGHTMIPPAILGVLFEHTVNQQHTGTYYTSSDVTRYIAQNTIIPAFFDAVERQLTPTQQIQWIPWQRLRTRPQRYLYPALTSTHYLPAETTSAYKARQATATALLHTLAQGAICTIDDVITHNLDISRFACDMIEQENDPSLLALYYEQLQRITVLDPTCGSGAFLLAALDVLCPLYQVCIERIKMLETHEELAILREQLRAIPNPRTLALTMAITHNLYGVDIMEEASEVCRLHLLLKLIAPLTDAEALATLPDPGEHIAVGNALNTAEESTTPSSSNETLNDQLQDRQAISMFHWKTRFNAVFQQGGFATIIGNPPYVEYTEQNFPYRVSNFLTQPCANLYTYVIERSQQLLGLQGRQGMIVPLAAFTTRNMRPFLDAFRRWFPCSWISFYHFRPAMLFSQGKHANIPMAIYLAKGYGAEQRYSSHLLKWSHEQRQHLFSLLTYCQITAPCDPENPHYYPKFGQDIENAILRKILAHQPVKGYLTHLPNENSMFYRSAGGLYWKVFVNFPWPYAATSNKQCSFQAEYERDVFVAVFNSSLFWWYYTVTFDTFNLKDYMLFGFRFTYPSDLTIASALQAQCQCLMENFQRHAKHLKRGRSNSYTIYAKKAKPILDEIDRILANHYGLSEAELNFILHYDIKYRLGHEPHEEA